MQSEELHHPILGGQRRLRREPRRGAGHTLRVLAAAGRRGVDRQRANAHRRPAEVAVLHRRACRANAAPVAVAPLLCSQIVDERIGRSAWRRPLCGHHRGHVHQPVRLSAAFSKLRAVAAQSAFSSTATCADSTSDDIAVHPRARAASMRHRRERLRVAGATHPPSVIVRALAVRSSGKLRATASRTESEAPTNQVSVQRQVRAAAIPAPLARAGSLNFRAQSTALSPAVDATLRSGSMGEQHRA